MVVLFCKFWGVAPFVALFGKIVVPSDFKLLATLIIIAQLVVEGNFREGRREWRGLKSDFREGRREWRGLKSDHA